MGKAVRDFGMVREGDRVAVAVSGGQGQPGAPGAARPVRPHAPAYYELAAIHVRGDATGITAPHVPLEEWLAARGLPYRIVEPD